MSAAKKNFLLLLFLAVLWGPSFLFIKVALQSFPPITVALIRVGVAAFLLFIVLKIKNIKLPKFSEVWKNFSLAALFQSAIPFTLFAVGEQYIHSSLAAILNGTTPLFTLIFAHFFIANDRMTKAKTIGATIGFCGLFMLVFPSLVGAHATALGVFAVLIAAISYGVAFVYTKKFIRGYAPLAVTTLQLFLSTLMLLPLALMEHPFAISHVTPAALGSVLGLAVFGTAMAFAVYYKIMEQSSATYASMVTYITPVFGIILGAVILGEKLAWNSYIGCAMVLTGVMFANGIISFSRGKNDFRPQQ